MTDKEIENFVNWLQSCTAKKFYSSDAEDLIYEFKNQALSQHDVIKKEVAVCPECGCNRVQKLVGENYSCMNAYCEWQTVL